MLLQSDGRHRRARSASQVARRNAFQALAYPAQFRPIIFTLTKSRSRAIYSRSATSGSRTWPRKTGCSYQSCIDVHFSIPKGTVSLLRRLTQLGAPRRNMPPGRKARMQLWKRRFGEPCQCSMESKHVAASRDSCGRSGSWSMTSAWMISTPYALCKSNTEEPSLRLTGSRKSSTRMTFIPRAAHPTEKRPIPPQCHRGAALPHLFRENVV